jgi:hypothetical protein
MGKPLMIQPQDDERIEHLKKDLKISKKIDVIRAALTLLENEANRIKRVQRWKNAARLVSKNSQAINKEFQAHSRLKSK